MAQTTRLIFANQLRGLAALCVVATHLIGVFWSQPADLAAATATPVINGSPSNLLALVSQPWFAPGPFGVALFFLISGLVIPISLARHSTTSFLVARALRIYPTLITALILEIALVHANAWHWGLPMPFGASAELSNVLLVYDLVGRSSIDLVNWTLLAEIKFYLLMAFLAGPVQRGRVTPLLITAAILAGANLAYAAFPVDAAPVRMLSLEAVLIGFMLIGVLFNYHLRGLLDLPRFVASMAVMLALFAISWNASVLHADLLIVGGNYLSALAFFSLAYTLRRYAIRVTALDWLAAISFPLYLVHLIIGVSTLKWLMLETGLPYLPALAISLLITTGVATLLHLGVERHTTNWGSRLAVVPSVV